MLGVYFVVNEADAQCWIKDSNQCEHDAELVSAGIYNYNVIANYVPTDTAEQASGIMQFIQKTHVDKHVALSWYEMNAFDAGKVFADAIEYRDSHIFYKYKGELYVFEHAQQKTK
jgi:ABC-type branched-subunit amino acid transport system substrate-binding protein